MEDGAWRDTRKSYLLCILLILLVSCSALLAATQGTIGQTSSAGSIAIRLHIPESTQLVAHKSVISNQQNAHICLHVVDSVARSTVDYYRIARLDHLKNGSVLQNEQALAASIKQAQLMQLRNYYGQDERALDVCGQQQILISPLKKDAAHPVLLMLISE